MRRNALTLFAMAAMFVLARVYLTPDALMVTMNGLLFGSLIALIVVMRSLTWNALVGRLRYRDAATFSVGLFLVIIGVCLLGSTSVYTHAADIKTPSFTIAALGRYAQFCGFILMAYSPDIGLSAFEGSDRKVVAGSVALGVIAAAVLIYMQSLAVLS